MTVKENFLWVEKYRPKTVAECILPFELRTTFSKIIGQKKIPNLLLVGGSGVGKTTVAKAMVNEINSDYIVINASLKGNIDTLRNDISNYASAMSFQGGRKYIILDEADYLTRLTQPALRNFMEEFSRNAGFILTANYQNRIIPELQSRCSVIEFNINKEDRPKLAAQFFKRVVEILTRENVEYDKPAVISIIQTFFPDWRRVLNELQLCSISGKIDEGFVLRTTSIADLLQLIKEKNFTGVRKWATENLHNNHYALYREFYDQASEQFKSSYIPMLVLTLAKYEYQSAFVLDQEINFSAFCAEVMVDAIWQ